MKIKPKSIRTFIGSYDFQESREFYNLLGFKEISLDKKMSYFEIDKDLGFYLQKYFVKDWVDNSMIFLEVENLEECKRELVRKNLQQKFKNVRISEIKLENWGKEFFMHDPSGILWQNRLGSYLRQRV